MIKTYIEMPNSLLKFYERMLKLISIYCYSLQQNEIDHTAVIA
jgi:hypothetical protein